MLLLWVLALEFVIERNGGLVESAENQLKLVWVLTNVANCIDARRARLKRERIDSHGILLKRETPIGNWTEFWGQAEQRYKVINVNLTR